MTKHIVQEIGFHSTSGKKQVQQSHLYETIGLFFISHEWEVQRDQRATETNSVEGENKRF